VKAKKIERELVQILEEENVSSDVGDLIPFERDDQFALVPPHRPDIVVRPSTREEVQEILKLANRHKVPVVPLASGINRKGLCIASKGGILLDLRRMNRILEINEEMMAATIEPGVSFGQLVQEARKKGFRVITPYAPSTASVLANYMLRGIYGTATRYGIDHLINMEVVLPDGAILQTGSAAFNQSLPYCNIVNGPDLCKLFQANPGTLGVVTKGVIRLYEMPEVIEPLIAIYPDYASMVEPSIEMTRRDLVASCWPMMFTGAAMKILTDFMGEDVYMMWLYLEGNRGQVERDKEAVEKITERYDGFFLPEVPMLDRDTMIKDQIWERTSVRGWKGGNMYGCSFYGVMKSVTRYYEVTREISKRHGFDAFHYESVPVAPFHGQLTYNDPCIFWDAGDTEQVKEIKEIHEEIKRSLADIGIYGWFRPFPSVVDTSKLGRYGEMWRKIKELIDPNAIMNPGKPPF